MNPSKTITVHVVKPSGTRFQFSFPETATPEDILTSLNRPQVKAVFGFNKTKVKKVDLSGHETEVEVEDRESGFIYDHPDTLVVIGKIRGDVFTETQRIKGPPKEAPKESPKEE